MKREQYNHKEIVGVDINIEISLKEYGFAWIETEKEILFYYGISIVENKYREAEFNRFDFCSFDKNMDIKKEFDYGDWDSINSFIGSDIMDDSFPEQIRILNDYYGYENIFGSTYWEGLKYNDIVKEEV